MNATAETGADALGAGIGRWIGRIVGAAAGAVFGPGGAIVGGIIGSQVGQMGGRAAAAAIAKMISEANAEIEEKASDQAAETVCQDCEIECFKPPKGADPEEFRKQLEEQQKAIRDMDPAQLAKNMRNYKRPNAADAAARRTTREDWLRTRTDELADRYSQSDDAASALRRAQSEAALELKKLNATHALDLVAGGDGSISGLGDASVNQSIGSQWKGKRARQLLKQAEHAEKTGKKMETTLEICPPDTPGGSKGDTGGANGGSTPGSGDGIGADPPPTS